MISSGETYIGSTNTDLSVSANLKVLLSNSTEILNSFGDFPQSITLEGDTTNIRIIQVVSKTHLVIMTLKSFNQSKIEQLIDKNVNLIQKVNNLITSTSK